MLYSRELYNTRDAFINVCTDQLRPRTSSVGRAFQESRSICTMFSRVLWVTNTLDECQKFKSVQGF